MIPILIGVFALVLVIGVAFVFMGRNRGGLAGGGKRSKDREAAVKEASKGFLKTPTTLKLCSSLPPPFLKKETGTRL